MLQQARGIGSKHYLPWVIMTDSMKDEKVCVILRRPHNTDDEAVTSAAYIRSVKEFSGMIYAMKFDDSYGDLPISYATIIARTSGCDPSQVRHLDIVKKEQEE